ncbi:tetratricopeptide repeat protein [Mariniflexile fucanivorans]|uniref:Tetratricopeptide repeat protein n=1 Tax=Mariniflexile fucanivorans TaxID=264023 RepID=A0A4R1RRE1_9FLAO|nr:histidine kinase [Mariniflexile fucanivorans]TCL68998.1 tetratricopeptide repeat protein [Mariniflexile fucanivorans]
MKLVPKHIWFVCVMLFSTVLLAQDNSRSLNSQPKFSVRGSVVESDSKNPIPNVNIEVNGGSYTTTDSNGNFRIEARKGDELTIKHKDFETVYYTILNNERIKVEVQPSIEDVKYSKKKYSRTNPELFKSLIDSAETYLKKDAKRSVQFIEKALGASNSSKENGEAYEVLGDIYLQWKQFDLAVSNYRISLQNTSTNIVKLKLASAYKQNNNYQESLQIYNSINKNQLSNWQLVELYEGLGDVNLLTKSYQASINAYNEGLKVAQKHLISPKVTDLNSKIAQVYNAKGETQKAKGFFDESLKLANNENKKRAVEEKIKVADFQNETNNYSGEIQLRKEALKQISEIQKEAVLSNESALTAQKQNYKIGNAYASQKDYENAIPYLKKSIEEADTKEDLIVQKDATRRLSEVYRDAGEFDKALVAYQSYVDLVDQLYSKKEQEISQAARFSKDIVSKQNRILSLESDRALSESKYELNIEQTKRQNIIIYSLIGGLVLLLVAGFLMFKYIKQQRLANNLLALKSLRSQMNPHFIFNALNSVNSFIASNDERAANKYLTDFSSLMRAVLENSEEDFIPLEKEIELLELYTKLEHFRFQDKFDYNITIDKNINKNDFVIPPMLLQPYIENAVWHGLRYKKSKGFLDIIISQSTPEEIKITITDDGIGREKSKALKTENQKKQNSKGMGNIKKRVAILNEMYKDKVDVFIDDFQDEEDTGTRVVVTLKKDYKINELRFLINDF